MKVDVQLRALALRTTEIRTLMLGERGQCVEPPDRRVEGRVRFITRSFATFVRVRSAVLRCAALKMYHHTRSPNERM